jgi:hypothetical protein
MQGLVARMRAAEKDAADANAVLAARQVGAPDAERYAERYRWVRKPSSGNIVYAMSHAGECGRNMDITIDNYIAQEKAS